MLKPLSILLLAGVMTVAGDNSALACGCASDQASPPASASAPNASRPPAAMAQNGRQSIRRYSALPTPSSRTPAYRAPVMRRGRAYDGPSRTATRKILGY